MIIIAGLMIALVCGIKGTHASDLSDEPLVGEWRMNAAKSTSTGAVRYTDGHIIARRIGKDRLAMKYVRHLENGTIISLSYEYGPDCIDCPVVGGQAGLTVARKKLGQGVYETTWKVAGVVKTVSRNTYSSDLNTLTNTATNVDASGHRYITVTVWERLKNDQRTHPDK